MEYYWPLAHHVRVQAGNGSPHRARDTLSPGRERKALCSVPHAQCVGGAWTQGPPLPCWGRGGQGMPPAAGLCPRVLGTTCSHHLWPEGGLQVGPHHAQTPLPPPPCSPSVPSKNHCTALSPGLCSGWHVPGGPHLPGARSPAFGPRPGGLAAVPHLATIIVSNWTFHAGHVLIPEL